MGFEIRIKTSEEGEVILRGNNDGTIDFCKEVQGKDPKTKKPVTLVQPYKYFVNIAEALNRVFQMRVNARNVETLKELLEAVEEEREELRKLFAGIEEKPKAKRTR